MEANFPRNVRRHIRAARDLQRPEELVAFWKGAIKWKLSALGHSYVVEEESDCETVENDRTGLLVLKDGRLIMYVFILDSHDDPDDKDLHDVIVNSVHCRMTSLCDLEDMFVIVASGVDFDLWFFRHVRGYLLWGALARDISVINDAGDALKESLELGIGARVLPGHISCAFE